MRIFTNSSLGTGAAAAGAFLAIVLASNQAAFAKEGQSTERGPGVARVSAVSGSVGIRRADSGQTVAAKANAPLIVGDFLSTGSKARAEMQLDNATFVRSGADAQTRFSRLDATRGTVQVARGTVELGRLDNSRLNPEIQTPLVTVRPQRAGDYRVTVLSNGNTLVTARSGRTELVTSRVVQTVDSGRTVLISGTQANPRFAAVQTVAFDNFDAWNERQDRAEDPNRGFGYANPAIVGITQLNSYGRWVSNPTYGQVWSPNNVQRNWAPYQNGSFAWEPYYGWTWVGNEPWGWAPYHYGNWFYDATMPGNGWAWNPNSAPQYGANPNAYIPGAPGQGYPADYNQGGYDQGGYYPGGYNQGGYNQGGYNQGGYNQGGYNPGGYNQGGYYPGGYNQGGYNQGGYYPGSQLSGSSALWVPAAVAFLDLLQGRNPMNDLASGLLSSMFGGYGGGYPNYGNGYQQPYYGNGYQQPYYGNGYQQPYYGNGYQQPYYGNGYQQPYYGNANPYGASAFPLSNIGWIPLAPNEQMYPWWGNWMASPSSVNWQTPAQQTVVNNYYQNVSIVKVTKIYRNFVAPNAVTIVSARDFASGRFSRRIPLSDLRDRIKNVVIVKSVLPIVPTQANLRFENRSVAAPTNVALFRRMPQPLQPPSFASVRPRVAFAAQRAYRLRLPVAASRLVAAELRPRPLMRSDNALHVMRATPGHPPRRYAMPVVQPKRHTMTREMQQAPRRATVARPQQPRRAVAPPQHAAPASITSIVRPRSVAPRVMRPVPQVAPRLTRVVPEAAPRVMRPVPEAAPRVMRVAPPLPPRKLTRPVAPARPEMQRPPRAAVRVAPAAPAAPKAAQPRPAQRKAHPPTVHDNQ
jgi:hypothetical protein